ncbi:MAG: hypothetical protein OJF60_001853 [Burkholderiaceae bacterium]|jgi:hypothetical protein|nr:MAG: hypothetical protein OJF60_001853 [Burkholderiaceae bacterium]
MERAHGSITMKRILVFAAQAMLLTGALAQVQLGNGQAGIGVANGSEDGSSAAVVGSLAPAPAQAVSPFAPVPAQDPAEQRRNELRAALQAQRAAQDKASAVHRLTPEERAELREQLRQFYPRTAGRIDRP